MTICIAWIRKVNNCEELVFASDSRLRYGEYWDQCPKIMSFERQDCALAFAGQSGQRKDFQTAGSAQKRRAGRT